MNITFLGTGTSQGVPVIGCDCDICRSNNSRDKRLRSSVMIKANDKVLVIDAGPDFRQQMLRENVNQLDAILLTHGHKDHTGGLDDVRAFNFLQQRPLDLYGSEEVLTMVRQEFSYAFKQDRYPGAPRINLVSIENSAFNIDGINIIPVEVMHYKMKVFGFRISDFTYITDASFIDGTEKVKIYGTKILVINALRRQKHHSHFSLDEAIAFSKEIQAETTYITHMGHSMGFYDMLAIELPDGIKPAYDGLVIDC